MLLSNKSFEKAPPEHCADRGARGPAATVRSKHPHHSWGAAGPAHLNRSLVTFVSATSIYRNKPPRPSSILIICSPDRPLSTVRRRILRSLLPLAAIPPCAHLRQIHQTLLCRQLAKTKIKTSNTIRLRPIRIQDARASVGSAAHWSDPALPCPCSVDGTKIPNRSSPADCPESSFEDEPGASNSQNRRCPPRG